MKDLLSGGVLFEEEDAWERWVYLTYDDQGDAVLLTRDEWEMLFRSAPEDQG